MQSVYWFCLIIGGAFVVLSMIGGGDILGDADADFDTDFDADLDIDADLDADLDGDIDTTAGGDWQVDTDVDLLKSPRQRRRIPGWLSVLLSFKFWTFGGCFFGLTGVLLSAIDPTLATPTVFAIALAVGILCGTLLVTILRSLKRRQVNSLVRDEDFAGMVGTVEIPFDAQSKGKVLLEVGGSTLHLVAQTDEDRAFKSGEPILVVGRTQNRLWVVSTENALKQPDSSSKGTEII